MQRRGRLRVLSRRDRVWLPGIALGAVWLTHLGAYLLAEPDPHERAFLLDSTGHGYLSIVGPIVVSVVIASIGGFVIDRSRSWATPLAVSYAEIAGRLAILQVLAFLGTEATERIVHGVPVADLVQPAVGIGLVLQFATACLGALLLFGLARAVEAIHRSLRAPRRATRVANRPRPATTVRRLIPGFGGPTLRGPPVSAGNV